MQFCYLLLKKQRVWYASTRADQLGPVPLQSLDPMESSHQHQGGKKKQQEMWNDRVCRSGEFSSLEWVNSPPLCYLPPHHLALCLLHPTHTQHNTTLGLSVFVKDWHRWPRIPLDVRDCVQRTLPWKVKQESSLYMKKWSPGSEVSFHPSRVWVPAGVQLEVLI